MTATTPTDQGRRERRAADTLAPARLAMLGIIGRQWRSAHRYADPDRRRAHLLASFEQIAADYLNRRP